MSESTAPLPLVPASEDPAPTSLSRRAALAVGAAGAGLGLLALAGPEDAAAKTAITGWRYCEKCRALFYSANNQPAGACAAGGKHRPNKAESFVLYYGPGDDRGYLVPYHRCPKCACLHRSEGLHRPCAKGGNHQTIGGQYMLWAGEGLPAVTDDAWDECGKCDAVFNMAGGNLGRCPAGGGHTRSDLVIIKLVNLY